MEKYLFEFNIEIVLAFDENQRETYDDWATRINDEYKQKHQKEQLPKQKTKKWTEKDQQQFLNELQKEQERKKEKQKNKSLHLKRNYLNFCENMKSCKNANLKLKDLPEVTTCEKETVVKNILFCDVKLEDQKRFIKEQLKLWHSDKFNVKYLQYFREKDRTNLNDVVKRFSQILSGLI